MFSHRYKFIYPGLLGLYSFFNILILDGDRLFQAALPKNQLFPLIIILSYLVWFANYFIEKNTLPLFKKVHPLAVQFLSSFVLISGLALISVKSTGLIFGGPFDLTKQNFLLTLGFLFRVNLFLNCVNAIYYFNKNSVRKTWRLKSLSF
jgi:hypothetical protein